MKGSHALYLQGCVFRQSYNLILLQIVMKAHAVNHELCTYLQILHLPLKNVIFSSLFMVSYSKYH